MLILRNPTSAERSGRLPHIDSGSMTPANDKQYPGNWTCKCCFYLVVRCIVCDPITGSQLKCTGHFHLVLSCVSKASHVTACVLIFGAWILFNERTCVTWLKQIYSVIRLHPLKMLGKDSEFPDADHEGHSWYKPALRPGCAVKQEN